MRCEAEHPPLRRGVAPGLGPRTVELSARNIGAARGSRRRRRKPDGGVAGDAVIVGAEIGAVQTEAMDEAALTVGDEE